MIKAQLLHYEGDQRFLISGSYEQGFNLKEASPWGKGGLLTSRAFA